MQNFRRKETNLNGGSYVSWSIFLTWELVTVLEYWVDRDKLQSYVRSKHENYNMRGENVKFMKLD